MARTERSRYRAVPDQRFFFFPCAWKVSAEGAPVRIVRRVFLCGAAGGRGAVCVWGGRGRERRTFFPFFPSSSAWADPSSPAAAAAAAASSSARRAAASSSAASRSASSAAACAASSRAVGPGRAHGVHSAASLPASSSPLAFCQSSSSLRHKSRSARRAAAEGREGRTSGMGLCRQAQVWWLSRPERVLSCLYAARTLQSRPLPTRPPRSPHPPAPRQWQQGRAGAPAAAPLPGAMSMSAASPRAF